MTFQMTVGPRGSTVHDIGIVMTTLPDNNPKTRFGVTKPNPFLVPPAATLYLALAMGNGAVKYGPYNWRENKVTASIYIAAALRHILAWIDGENLATDSGVPHIAHAMACLAILADAKETGNLIDDRPASGAAPSLIESWTKSKEPTPYVDGLVRNISDFESGSDKDITYNFVSDGVDR